jgi:hypothetical protein
MGTYYIAGHIGGEPIDEDDDMVEDRWGGGAAGRCRAGRLGRARTSLRRRATRRRRPCPRAPAAPRTYEAFERRYAGDHSWEGLQEDEQGRLRPVVSTRTAGRAQSAGQGAGQGRPCLRGRAASGRRSLHRQWAGSAAAAAHAPSVHPPTPTPTPTPTPPSQPLPLA